MLVWLRNSQVPCVAARDRQVEVVQRITCRMCQRNIQRLEVVPLVFDLRTVRHRKAQPAHDAFEFFDRLGDGMQTPQSHAAARQRGIEFSDGSCATLSIRRLESVLGGGKRAFDLRLDFVQPQSGRRAIRRLDLSHELLNRLHAPFLGAHVLNACRFQGGSVCRGIEGRHRGCHEFVQLLEEFSQCHASTACSRIKKETGRCFACLCTRYPRCSGNFDCNASCRR